MRTRSGLSLRPPAIALSAWRIRRKQRSALGRRRKKALRLGLASLTCTVPGLQRFMINQKPSAKAHWLKEWATQSLTQRFTLPQGGSSHKSRVSQRTHGGTFFLRCTPIVERITFWTGEFRWRSRFSKLPGWDSEWVLLTRVSPEESRFPGWRWRNCIPGARTRNCACRICDAAGPSMSGQQRVARQYLERVDPDFSRRREAIRHFEHFPGAVRRILGLTEVPIRYTPMQLEQLLLACPREIPDWGW